MSRANVDYQSKPTHPTSYKISLNYTSNTHTPDRNTVLITMLNKLDIHLTSLATSNTGYIAHAAQMSHIDKIIKNENTFLKIHLKPIPPPQLLAQRTLLVRQVDDSLGEMSPDDLKAEILQHQPHLKIDHIVKIPQKTRMFKIVCGDSVSADNLASEGFKASYFYISPNQINKETYTHINTCYKCYRIEAHATKDCPEPTQTCSNCAQSGHSYRDCRNTHIKCVNCTRANKQSNHHTMEMRCPFRKEAIVRKRPPLQTQGRRPPLLPTPQQSQQRPTQLADQRQNNNAHSYASVTSNSQQRPRNDTSNNAHSETLHPIGESTIRSIGELTSDFLTRDTMLLIAACITEAKLKASWSGNESNYSQLVKQNLARNIGIEIVVEDLPRPDNSPPSQSTPNTNTRNISQSPDVSATIVDTPTSPVAAAATSIFSTPTSNDTSISSTTPVNSPNNRADPPRPPNGGHKTLSPLTEDTISVSRTTKITDTPKRIKPSPKPGRSSAVRQSQRLK